MSATIEARNKRSKWAPNSAGWTVCAVINLRSGELVSFPFGEHRDGSLPRPPDQLSAAQARDASDTINLRMLESDSARENRAKVLNDVKGLFDGGDRELVEYIKAYVAFLKSCKGYLVI